jgi:hypothetical protein
MKKSLLYIPANLLLLFTFACGPDLEKSGKQGKDTKLNTNKKNPSGNIEIETEGEKHGDSSKSNSGSKLTKPSKNTNNNPVERFKSEPITSTTSNLTNGNNNTKSVLDNTKDINSTNTKQKNGHDNNSDDAPSKAWQNKVSPEFKQAFESKFANFPESSRLDLAALDTLTRTTPDQKNNPWACGKLTSQNAIQKSFLNTGRELIDAVDISQVGDYRTAVNLTKEDFITQDPSQNILLLLAYQVINERFSNSIDNGNIIIGALPGPLAKYINARLAKNSGLSAKNYSSDNMDASTLKQKVNNNLALKMPTPIYARSGRDMVHVFSIVGLHNDNLLLLDTGSNGVDRLSSSSVNDMIDKMDMADTISELKKTVSLKQMFPEHHQKLVSEGKIPNDADLESLKRFNLIEFKKN